eukprot:11180623-Lingulodinium_polyedra.AAC.1
MDIATVRIQREFVGRWRLCELSCVETDQARVQRRNSVVSARRVAPNSMAMRAGPSHPFRARASCGQ